MDIDVEEFIGVKGFKAHGRRVTKEEIGQVEELEPTRFPEPEDTNEETNEEEETQNTEEEEEKNEQQAIDEMTGQLNLFSDDNEDKS